MGPRNQSVDTVNVARFDPNRCQMLRPDRPSHPRPPRWGPEVANEATVSVSVSRSFQVSESPDLPMSGACLLTIEWE